MIDSWFLVYAGAYISALSLALSLSFGFLFLVTVLSDSLRIKPWKMALIDVLALVFALFIFVSICSAAIHFIDLAMDNSNKEIMINVFD